MNTGFVRPAVATVLTACGIETFHTWPSQHLYSMLQQYLPLAVLKRSHLQDKIRKVGHVATVLTACGIET